MHLCTIAGFLKQLRSIRFSACSLTVRWMLDKRPNICLHLTFPQQQSLLMAADLGPLLPMALLYLFLDLYFPLVFPGTSPCDALQLTGSLKQSRINRKLVHAVWLLKPIIQVSNISIGIMKKMNRKIGNL